GNKCRVKKSLKGFGLKGTAVAQRCRNLPDAPGVETSVCFSGGSPRITFFWRASPVLTAGRTFEGILHNSLKHRLLKSATNTILFVDVMVCKTWTWEGWLHVCSHIDEGSYR